MDKLEESLQYIKCGTFSTLSMGLSGIVALGYINLMVGYNLSGTSNAIAMLLTGTSIANSFISYLHRNKYFDKSKEAFKEFYLEKQNSGSRISKEELEKIING